jgi:hypothetical protein
MRVSIQLFIAFQITPELTNNSNFISNQDSYIMALTLLVMVCMALNQIEAPVVAVAVVSIQFATVVALKGSRTRFVHAMEEGKCHI